MRFHATYVSVGRAGDYYQACFEAVREGDGTPYLLIQRQFEDYDGGVCYMETNDLEYRGHFRLRDLEFSPTRLSVDLGRQRQSLIEVTFALSEAEFAEAAHIVDIIAGTVGPDVE